MPPKMGMIALMGSGELTATMVEVHKDLLGELGGSGRSPKAVFIDTPAGFQLNVDQISRKAVEYFQTRIQHPLTIASFKSIDISSYEAEQAYHILRSADFVLIGPGSPTFAVKQWGQTPIPDILIKRIESGGCLVAASAAALTVGRMTLPVYEIYKVGQDIHWIEGMDILHHFGFDLVVIPHWNNAEGGTHDTRFCFMGEPRFRQLEKLLPRDVSILGLDEHTACILDLDKEEADIRGIGRVTLRRNGEEQRFESGTRFPLEVLRGGDLTSKPKANAIKGDESGPLSEKPEDSFWDRIHFLETSFQNGLERSDPKESTNALLELDRAIWQATQDLENEEFISQARDVMRELIVRLGTRLSSSPGDKEAFFAPLVEALLKLRETFRSNSQWKEADAIRDCLQEAGIIIEDSKDGSLWQMR